MLIANSLLVPHWATADEFRRLEGLGLTMYGQMTAGSWIYIGTQGILQGTYETLAECARQHFGGSLAGRLTVTAGLGGMGGAQPLAVTMNEGVCLVAEVDRSRIERRLATRYLDTVAPDIPTAVERALAARDRREAISIAVEANAVDLLEHLVATGLVPDALTDQTSAHDALQGYVPHGISFAEALRLRAGRPARPTSTARMASMAAHVRAMLALQERGRGHLRLRQQPARPGAGGGGDRAFEIGGFVPLFIRPLFCEGKGPFRWVALSGDPEDLAATDEAILATFPEDAALARWIRLARERVAFQGLPARICWLGYGERAKAGKVFNELVASGQGEGADRDRPRPPRLRLGRLAQPRDRGDARRLGRDRRLADPQRAGQRRQRRHLGLRPPRRRRGHRLLAARRHGDRGRRHRGGGAAAGAGAHRRSRHGRRAPRRRRLPGGDRLRPGARRGPADVPQ